MRHHILVARPIPSRIGIALAMAIASLLMAWHNAMADESLPNPTPDFVSIVRAHSDQLAKIGSDKDAISLFVSAIGPALQLGDAARTLGAISLQPKLANELLVSELTAAVHRLMGSLAAWRLASTITQAVRDQQLSTETDRLYGSPQSNAWLHQQGKTAWQDSLNQLSEMVASPEWGKGIQRESAASIPLITVLEKAARLELDAMQTGFQEWDRIRSWKDRVRGLRGQARLCGTWQWIIHNHQQHHQEQKLILIFPPAGNTKSTLLGLAETIVLGENVYLRWEVGGRIQEDSLQFSKEGQRLEGTFLNSEGGWGSISGKKTAGCAS
jgi:hypothetical protein